MPQLNLLPDQPNAIPFQLQLDTLRKIIKRDFFGEPHLVFLHENGDGWSFFPKQAYGRQGLEASIKHLVHRIKEAMMQMGKTVCYEEQQMVEKRIFCLTQASWETIPTEFD